jgi:formyltetrahydrofolate deformylase
MQYILKIDCPDQKGLIHQISGVLFSAGLNIIENEEFVDHRNNYFFMRSEVTGELNQSKVFQQLSAVLPEKAVIQIHKKKKKDIIVFATREYHCLGDLLIRHHFGELKANIQAVISNHEYLKDFTERFGVPFYHIPADNIERAEHENKVLSILSSYNPEYLVLAKYMRVLTPQFSSQYSNRIINIHHSFLPAFIGARPYEQAFERGVKLIGATAHFVNENLDEGPIITQDVIHTNHKNDAAMMAKAGKDVEKIVLSNALKLVFDDRVFVYCNKTIIFE